MGPLIRFIMPTRYSIIFQSTFSQKHKIGNNGINAKFVFLFICEGRIFLRESSQGESSGLSVRLEGLSKTHYDGYSLLANAYSLC